MLHLAATLRSPLEIMQKPRLSLVSLAWPAALLPFITIHVSYILAASQGHVEWCMPYWDACTSISATGRQMPEKLWFKLGMLTAAGVTALLWWQLGRSTGKSGTMVILGILACVFLTMYTLALGVEGDTYQRIRRIGITLSFAFTFLAQLLYTRFLGQRSKSSHDPLTFGWSRFLLGLITALLIIGILSVVLDAALGERYDDYEDAFEWILALLLNSWFAGLAMYLMTQRERQ